MSFIVGSSALAEAAVRAAKHIPASSSQPILAGVRLATEDQVLTITGWDFTTLTISHLPIEGELPEPVVIHGRTLADATKRLRGPVSFTELEQAVSVSAGRSSFVFQVMPADHYPSPPSIPDAVGTVDGIALRAAATRAAVACVRNPGAPRQVGSLLLTAMDGILTIQGTDCYRVLLDDVPWKGRDFTALVAATRLTALLVGMDGPLDLLLSEHAIGAATPSRAFVTSLTQLSDHPGDISRLIPATGPDRSLIVNCAELIGAVEAALIGTKGPRVELDITPGAITVKASSEHSANTITLDAEAEFTESLPITGALLLDLLKTIPTQRVRLDVPNPRKPFGIHPTEGGESPRIALMPILTR